MSSSPASSTLAGRTSITASSGSWRATFTPSVIIRFISWDDGIIPAEQPWHEVYQAGPGSTEELEVDDLVQARALDYLREPARQDRPWALNVSFIAPHFPYIAPQRFWDMYPPDEMDLPELPDGHLETLHPMAQRIRTMFGFPQFPDEVVRRARAGYYALITYFDEKIGELLDALEATGQRENTVIIHLSDHGDMNGEHGMWRKSNFYDASARVPLQVVWPGRIDGGRRLSEVVSLVDVSATVCDIAGDDCDLPLDGDSLLPLLTNGDPTWKDEAFCEYLAHGTDRPMAMLRRGRYKLNYSWGDPVELYDLAADPGEFHDLAGEADYQALAAEMEAALLADWDPAALDRQVRESQRQQRFIEAEFRDGLAAGAVGPPNPHPPAPSPIKKAGEHGDRRLILHANAGEAPSRACLQCERNTPSPGPLPQRAREGELRRCEMQGILLGRSRCGPCVYSRRIDIALSVARRLFSLRPPNRFVFYLAAANSPSRRYWLM